MKDMLGIGVGSEPGSRGPQSPLIPPHLPGDTVTLVNAEGPLGKAGRRGPAGPPGPPSKQEVWVRELARASELTGVGAVCLCCRGSGGMFARSTQDVSAPTDGVQIRGCPIDFPLGMP